MIVGMPNMPFLYAMDFIEVLKKKQAAGTYKEMVKGSVLALHLVPDHIIISLTCHISCIC